MINCLHIPKCVNYSTSYDSRIDFLQHLYFFRYFNTSIYAIFLFFCKIIYKLKAQSITRLDSGFFVLCYYLCPDYFLKMSCSRLYLNNLHGFHVFLITFLDVRLFLPHKYTNILLNKCFALILNLASVFFYHI